MCRTLHFGLDELHEVINAVIVLSSLVHPNLNSQHIPSTTATPGMTACGEPQHLQETNSSQNHPLLGSDAICRHHALPVCGHMIEETGNTDLT